MIETFFRAIGTSDFERRLKEAADDLSRNSGAAAGWAGARAGPSTDRRDFAADLLQMQQIAIAGENDG